MPAGLSLALGLMILALALCASSEAEDLMTPPAPAEVTFTVPAATPSPGSALPSPTLVSAGEDAPLSEPGDETVTPPGSVGASPTNPPPLAPPTPEPQSVEHKVRAGESLLGLAMDYGVPMAAIQLENGLGEVTAVWEGQVLAIPPPAGWEGASTYWLLHLVKAGETLGGIAASYDLALGTVRSANELDTDLLAIGQALIMPLEAPIAALMPAPTQAPAGSASGEEGGPGTAPPLSADLAAWPHELFQLINQVRAGHGLYPLAYNETLAWAAQLHAEDCAQRGWCSHTGSDGASSQTRILRAGYPAVGTAECWVKTDTPQDAFDFWYYEVPPNDVHRRTLLSSYITEIGIGIVPTNWGYYFVADFGQP